MPVHTLFEQQQLMPIRSSVLRSCRTNGHPRRNHTMLGAVTFLSFLGSVFAGDLRVPTEYATIQAAVNAAKDDDTIRIASGVYLGQIEIGSKRLSLIGQPGTILRATSDLVPWSGSPGKNVPLMTVYSSEVTLRGLTFEGERLAGRYSGRSFGDLVALYIWRSHADIEQCAFYGFREETPGAEGAGSLWFQALHEGDFNLHVGNCTFADNYGAILAAGEPERQNLHVTILNNTIQGLGPIVKELATVGIDIGEGVGGRIAGNTISDFSYIGTTDPFPISFGILGINRVNFPESVGRLHPLLIEGNTLRNNQVHLSLNQGDNAIVRNNRFLGTAPGFLPLGAAISGTNVVIANNQFEAMPEGIRLWGRDPVFGELLGFAIDAQLLSNRFCNVTIPITQQVPAEATIQGTLSCESTTPILNIAPAVTLSWLTLEEGYSVQVASLPDGPWNPLNASPIWRDGKLTVTVPASAGNRFFRLWKP